MTIDGAVNLFGAAMILVAMVAGPMLLAALCTGLVVGILQAATQVNEASIAFVTKLIAVGVMFVVVGPWAVRQLVDYTARTFSSIATIVH